METATKPKKRSSSFRERYEKWAESHVRDEKLAIWLEVVDKSLWGNRDKWKSAKIAAEKHLGCELVTFVFKCHVLRYCRFFQSPDWKGASSPTRAIAGLSSRQWDKLHLKLRWIYDPVRNNLFDPADPSVTLDFLIRYLRREGAPASREILRNCSLFRQLSDRRFF